MSEKRGVSRREFLRFGAGGVVGLAGLSLLAACGPQAPAAPKAEAPKPTEAARPADASKPAAATSAPAAAPAATSAPAAAAKPAAGKPEANLGKQFIGKLEGPEVLVDARRPEKLAEAPMLADLVKAGKLPPVEQRVPLEPLVIKPLNEIGKYGGTLRRGFTGPGDDTNGIRFMNDTPLVWDFGGTKQVPCLLRALDIADGGKTFTLSLRKGMKWSDGQPFTADDWVFWYQDIYLNKELVPTGSPEFAINGKQGVIEKVDEATVRFRFEEPYPLFQLLLSGLTYVGGGQSFNRGFFGGGYAPAHYLKQFLPKYSSEEAVNQKAREAKFDTWVLHIRNKIQFAYNPDLPVVMPWKTTTPITGPTWTLERNPYYFGVDPQGNQLPYIDKLQFTLAENLEVLNLRAGAGEFDWQERHILLDKLPVFIENQQKGNYSIHLDPAGNGADAAFQLNQSYEADPEIAKWLKNRDFRHALSLGIDRDQLNETFWLGIGLPGNVSPDESSPYSPGPGSRQKWATYDLKQANELLDKLGLTKKDAEGFRLRADGSGRLRLVAVAIAGAFAPFPRIGEMVAQQWKKIGIQLDVQESERNDGFARVRNNEHQIMIWQNDGSEQIFTFPRHALPVEPSEPNLGPLYAQWYASAGDKGKKPDDPQLLKAIELFGQAKSQSPDQAAKTAQEIWKILIEETWSIGTVGVSPAVSGVRIVKNTLGNVPAREMNVIYARTPGSSHPVTAYFKS